jgi:hypothetical protein
LRFFQEKLVLLTQHRMQFFKNKLLLLVAHVGMVYGKLGQIEQNEVALIKLDRFLSLLMTVG